eukprot:5410922-Alexandrium_andersonii.AAC.1
MPSSPLHQLQGDVPKFLRAAPSPRLSAPPGHLFGHSLQELQQRPRDLGLQGIPNFKARTAS